MGTIAEGADVDFLVSMFLECLQKSCMRAEAMLFPPDHVEEVCVVEISGCFIVDGMACEEDIRGDLAFG